MSYTGNPARAACVLGVRTLFWNPSAYSKISQSLLTVYSGAAVSRAGQVLRAAEPGQEPPGSGRRREGPGHRRNQTADARGAGEEPAGRGGAPEEGEGGGTRQGRPEAEAGRG